MLALQWNHIHNSNLKEYLTQNSTKLLDSCKKLLTQNVEYGRYLHNNIITPNLESALLQKEKELYHILKVFSRINPDYYCSNFELHIKDNSTQATAQHADIYTWMHSDANLVNQVWILLYNDSENNYKNLDLFDNLECGLFRARDSLVQTLDGYKDYKPTQIFDGTNINLGDILVFQNGIIHGTNPKTDIPDNSHRMALAVSFYKCDWVLTNNLMSYYCDFWIQDKTRTILSKSYGAELYGHPYARKIIKDYTLIKNPQKVQKKQDIEWFNILCYELKNAKIISSIQ